MSPASLRAALNRSWNRFFFDPIDPRPIGIFRILFGSILVINAMLISTEVLTWYGRRGVLSMETLHALVGARLNLLTLLPPGDSWVIGFHCFHMVAALFLTLGLFTRVSAIAVFLTLVSLHHRNPFILNSGDTLIRIISFLLIFSQAGAAYSLDWIRGVIRGDRPVTPLPTSPWAQRMIQIQICMVYLITVIAKLRGSSWWDGTAIYYASRLEQFQRFPVPWIFENLILIRLITWSTLIVELSAATLIWNRRLRPYILILVISLHLGIEYAMNIPLFEWLMICALIPFLDQDELRAWSSPVARQTGTLVE